MSNVRSTAIAWVIAASLCTAAAFGQAPIPRASVSHGAPAAPKALTQPKIPHPDTEAADDEDLEVAQSTLESSPGALRPAAISVAAGAALTPPVTITYSGSSVALMITDSGTNRGLHSLLTNPGNNNSAVYGDTKGTAAGVKGINTGINGYGGVFLVANPANTKPALTATTNGPGSAIVATNTVTNSNQPAIIGTNTTSTAYGIGVQGVGNDIGLYGVDGYAPNGVGVAGISTSSTGYGIYAKGDKGDAVHADSTSSYGIWAHSADYIGLFAYSDHYLGIVGQSTNSTGVAGDDLGSGIGVQGLSVSGYGVYGHSVTGYAGYFLGKVSATSYLTNSDRNAKTEFKPIDGGSVLELVSRLPITSWAFKEDPKQRHIGPMAQDFHAAFGLSGTDDKHINLSDAAGVSLVAIQELNKRLQEKDVRIAALEGQLKSMNDAFSLRLAKLEEQASADPQIVTASVPSGR
jgi:hypothetical protein